MTNEFGFGDGKKLNINDFKREVKEGKLSRDEKFKKILSAFDVNKNGTADDGEIEELFTKMSNFAARNGNSVFEEDEINDFLETTVVDGKSLKSEGISANELLGFFKADTKAVYTMAAAPEREQNPVEAIKDDTIEFIESEFENGMSMLEGYDAGIISKGYDGIKEFLGSRLTKSNVARNLYVKLETAQLLKRAKNGELTYKQYFSAIKGVLYDIFPRTEKVTEQNEKELKQRIDALSPEQVERNINKVLQLPNPKDKDYQDSLYSFMSDFTTETSTSHSVRQDGKTITSKTINEPYKLNGNDDRLMTFEEVFKFRYGKDFDAEKYEELNSAKLKLSLMSSTFNSYKQIYSVLRDEILSCEGLMEPGRGNEQLLNQHNLLMQSKLIEVMNNLGLSDDDSKNRFLSKFASGDIEIKDGRFQKKNGNNIVGIGKTDIAIYEMVNIAKNLIAFLEKNTPSEQDLAEQAGKTDKAYRELFGDKDADSLVSAYKEDSENAVHTLRTGIEVVGGAAMIVGMIACTPLAVAGAVIGGAGGIATEALNEISRKQPNGDKLKELGIELAQNAALFGTGMGATKAGMSARALLIAQKCPKLVACIADVGVDITLSAISNLIITGDLQLEGEGIAQIVSLIAGHIKAGRFKTVQGLSEQSPQTKPKEKIQETEPAQVKEVPEPTKEQIKEQKKLAEQNQKIAEKIGDDFELSDMDAEILKGLKDGQYHVITDKNGNQVKITKNGEEFDIELIGKAQSDMGTRSAVHNPYIARNGLLERNSSYILNLDLLPKIDIGGGEIIDLESKMFKDVILSMRDGDSFTVGREGNFVTNQNNPYSSREHFIVYKQNGIIKIRDMSTNGTKIVRDDSSVVVKNISSGKMNSNQPYIINENDLPKLRLANRETLDLNDYRAILSNLQEGQSLTIGREGNIRFGSDDGISRKHLIIYRSNGILKIKDISVNGTTIEASGIIAKIKNKINKAIDYFDGSALSREEFNILNAFKDNPAVASAMGSASASHRMVKKIMKVLDNKKYVSVEIKEAILNGYANLGRSTGNVRCKVNKCIMDDIIKLATGEDYIRKYSSSTPKAKILSETPVGEVASVNGILYMNNGYGLERINMSEKTFRKLFPPVSRFSVHQGNIGTCYLVSALERLYSTPLGRVQLYRLIGEDSKGIYTVTANSKGVKNYFRRFDGQYKHILDENGLAIIEQGYCKNERTNALGINPSETRIMSVNHGGNSADAIKGLLGKTPTSTNDAQSICNYIMKYANNENFIINIGTKGGNDSNLLSREYDLFAGHEYSVKGYNPATDSVIISNPWHSGVTVEVPMSEVLKYFEELVITSLV